jgi:hypothetical protein
MGETGTLVLFTKTTSVSIPREQIRCYSIAPYVRPDGSE